METCPPRIIEAIIERLVPPASRESVLGDWNESYASTPDYVLRALSALPLLVASQVRRTFKVGRVVSQAVMLYLAYALIFFARPSSPLAHEVLIPILIVICTALLALVISGCLCRSGRSVRHPHDSRCMHCDRCRSLRRSNPVGCSFVQVDAAVVAPL